MNGVNPALLFGNLNLISFGVTLTFGVLVVRWIGRNRDRWRNILPLAVWGVHRLIFDGFVLTQRRAGYIGPSEIITFWAWLIQIQLGLSLVFLTFMALKYPQMPSYISADELRAGIHPLQKASLEVTDEIRELMGIDEHT